MFKKGELRKGMNVDGLEYANVESCVKAMCGN